MAMLSLWINGEERRVEAPDGIPLLWLLRDQLDLPGTKFGCGRGLCGACTVHLDGEPTRSCMVTAAEIGARRVTTIEGLAATGAHTGKDGGTPAARDGAGAAGSDDLAALHPCQRAWIEEDVPQCGYCQAGQIMTAAALLARNPRPDDDAIDAALAGNLCRCGTYVRIRRAIKRAAGLAGGTP